MPAIANPDNPPELLATALLALATVLEAELALLLAVDEVELPGVLPAFSACDAVMKLVW
jgi:hypothetical protein